MSKSHNSGSPELEAFAEQYGLERPVWTPSEQDRPSAEIRDLAVFRQYKDKKERLRQIAEVKTQRGLSEADLLDIKNRPSRRGTVVPETPPNLGEHGATDELIGRRVTDKDSDQAEIQKGKVIREYYQGDLPEPNDDETKRLPPIKISEQFMPSEAAIRAAISRMQVFLSQGRGGYRFEEFIEKYKELLGVCKDENQVETIIDRLMIEIEIEEQNGET